MRTVWRFLTVGAALWASAAVSAQELSTTLREEVLMLKKSGLFTLELETTLYRPPGDGPHPLVVINHGKAPGDPRFQARARHTLAAREFVQRGYAVAIPMRQGFSKSGGAYVGGGCNVGGNGTAQAEDVKAVLDALAATRPDLDTRRVVVLGQSHGGLTTMALGAMQLLNVVGLVNFAGGLRQEQCPAWEQTLARDVGGYAARTKVPSVWFYGDNDAYFLPRVWQDMHAQYTAAGGRAKLVAFGTFGADAHAMFGARAGLPIWLPPLQAFFTELGLPFDKRHAIALAEHESAPPPGSGFAVVDDVEAVPHLKNDAARNGYRAFLAATPPKAFALAPNGAWSWRADGAGVMRAALERCQSNAKETACRLYAVDDQVVWTADKP
jgi:dienelactone hydrolase